ncbi:MAG: hypothetical protein K6U80_05455 [Firmicutes bacterium]|nr:hypothetical protein [Bacillota bacterium]
MAQPVKQPPYIIVITPSLCPDCDQKLRARHPNIIIHPYTITVGQISPGKKSGWIATETGTYQSDGGAICENCKGTYGAQLDAIPIECATYDCPKCGQPDSLHYEVHDIKRLGDDSFKFAVAITCTGCKTKNIVKGAISDLYNTDRVYIGPTGIFVS